MRRQNVKLLNRDGNHMRWLSLEEAERMTNDGQARRISKRKAPQAAYQLISFPDLSTSDRSAATLTHSDMQILANLPKGFIEGLTTGKLREMPQGRIQSLQRLAGWGLLPHSQALADAGEAPG